MTVELTSNGVWPGQIAGLACAWGGIGGHWQQGFGRPNLSTPLYLAQVNHKQVYSEKYKEPPSPGADSELVAAAARCGGGSSAEASPRCGGSGGSGEGAAASTAAAAACRKKRRLKSYLSIAVTKSLDQLADGRGGQCEEDDETASAGGEEGGGGGGGGLRGSRKGPDAAASGVVRSRKAAERAARGTNLSGLTVQMTDLVRVRGSKVAGRTHMSGCLWGRHHACIFILVKHGMYVCCWANNTHTIST